MALHRLSKRRDPNIPHVPFWKDERIFGKRITVSTYLRVLIVSVVLFVLTIGFCFFALLNYLHDAHVSRVQDQKETDQKIANLACIAIRHIPSRLSDVVRDLRNTYHCPPATPRSSEDAQPSAGVGKGSAKQISPSSLALPGRPGATVTRIGAAGSGKHANSKGRSGASTGRKPTPTHKASPPPVKPTPRPTPKPTPTHTTAPPIIELPGPGKTCQLGALGVCILG